METIKVMIVDDSPFSRTILADSLQEAGCKVVGEADGIENLVDTYNSCRPDLVTMDIAMPGADGFECSKILLMHDPQAKIILISSMKDEETEAEARRAGIVGYVQKPVDNEALVRVIGNALAPDALFRTLQNGSMDIFKEALAQSITRMTKTTVLFADEVVKEGQLISEGITVVLGIIGRYAGSLIIDMSPETANQMTETILRRPAKNRDEMIAMAGEFANVVGGVACSILNKKDKSFALRVAPPSIFFGTTTEVVSPSIQVETATAETAYGRISLSIGFKKGSVLWM